MSVSPSSSSVTNPPASFKDIIDPDHQLEERKDLTKDMPFWRSVNRFLGRTIDIHYIDELGNEQILVVVRKSLEQLVAQSNHEKKGVYSTIWGGYRKLESASHEYIAGQLLKTQNPRLQGIIISINTTHPSLSKTKKIADQILTSKMPNTVMIADKNKPENVNLSGGYETAAFPPIDKATRIQLENLGIKWYLNRNSAVPINCIRDNTYLPENRSDTDPLATLPLKWTEAPAIPNITDTRVIYDYETKQPKILITIPPISASSAVQVLSDDAVKKVLDTSSKNRSATHPWGVFNNKNECSGYFRTKQDATIALIRYTLMHSRISSSVRDSYHTTYTILPPEGQETGQP
jgi:hypothetical protein